MKLKQNKLPGSWFFVLFWILLVNIVILDGFFLYAYVHKNDVLGETTGESCPQSCIARMNQIAGSKGLSSLSKEYYVPLGSGSNTTDEWADVVGASVYIDTASYGRMKQVSFEVTTAIPAGAQRVWVRLYNATDKHPVWFSEVATDNASPTLLTSKPVTLDKGNKLYQVQMKTQLKILTNLVQSRLRIITY